MYTRVLGLTISALILAYGAVGAIAQDRMTQQPDQQQMQSHPMGQEDAGTMEQGIGTVFSPVPGSFHVPQGRRASMMRWKPHARNKEPPRLESEDLDFLARIRLRVIDPDLKHGKTFL